MRRSFGIRRVRADRWNERRVGNGEEEINDCTPSVAGFLEVMFEY